jgi:hypothetical protein
MNPTQLSFMETTEEKKNSRSVKHDPKQCANPLCKKEFTPKNLRALYCSPSCNAKASVMRSASGFASQQTQPAFAGLGSLGGVFAIPPHAEMMIKLSEKEATRWENAYNEEKVDHKKTKDELEAVKEQAKEEKRPGGLEGFAERNPQIAEKLLDFGLAMANKFGDKIVTQSGPGEPAQVLQGIPGQAGEMVRVFSEWLPKLDDDTQKAVWALLNVLASEDAEKMRYSIQHILQAWRK